MSLPKSRPSQPLSFEGHGGIGAQLRELELKQVGRSEWWLWFSALSVTVLALAGLLLCSFPRFFAAPQHFYELRADQAQWGILSLVVLFDAWMVYRQWSFRRMRKGLAGEELPAETPRLPEDPSGLDPVTGLMTRAAIEQQLGKEIARAHRHNTSLTLAAFHLDDFDRLSARGGKAAGDELLKEFGRRMKDASRGSDSAARIANDEFLLVLPKCTLQEAKVVLDRLGTVAVQVAGQRLVLAYTSGWVDYQRGDSPSDLLRRATEILELYKGAGEGLFSDSLAG
jgi:diguanylate cyclase (GGDEF)-like protein